MSNSTSFAPNEPFASIEAERGVLVGICLGFGAWGVLLALAVLCLKSLLGHLEKLGNKIFLGYVFVMFSLGTIVVSTHLKWYQTFLIDNRNYPGGPIAYDHAFYANGPNIAGDVCAFTMNWLADGLLVYRLYVIWEHNLLVFGLPLLMFLTSFSLSVVELIIVSHPGNSEFVPKAINFGQLYWSFSIALNILITILIVIRLMYHRHHIIAAVSAHNARVYFSAVAIFTESAALYSCAAIVFLVGYSRQNLAQWAVEPVMIIQGIAPLMIIYRIAIGTAYSENALSTYNPFLGPGASPRVGETFKSTDGVETLPHQAYAMKPLDGSP